MPCHISPLNMELRASLGQCSSATQCNSSSRYRLLADGAGRNETKHDCGMVYSLHTSALCSFATLTSTTHAHASPYPCSQASLGTGVTKMIAPTPAPDHQSSSNTYPRKYKPTTMPMTLRLANVPYFYDLPKYAYPDPSKEHGRCQAEIHLASYHY